MITMYLCGPTLYSDIHIGNARSLVLFDVIAEYHRRNGGVKYARNITDVDDKIITLSGDVRPDVWVTENTLPNYRRDLAGLGIKDPDFEPRASEFISEMINDIQLIIDNGFGIIKEDGVYLDPSKSEEYGKVSGRTTTTPFALWKLKEGHGWESPWGHGRPAWHIECSSMIKSVFGSPVDLHGGGTDLVFPHHENENAQQHCAHGHGVAKEFLHVGTVNVSDNDNNFDKMSKSLNNVVQVKDLIRDWSIGALRTSLLMTASGKPINFSFNRLKEAEKIFSKNPEHAFLTDVEWTERQLTSLANGYRTRL